MMTLSTRIVAIKAKDPSHLERCCWFLFDAIIKAHELGVLIMPANNWSPSKLTCSARLAATVAIIEKYAPVRLDILRLWHIEEVAANPDAFVKRKLINCWNNSIRAQKNKTKKTAVQETGNGEEAQSSADVEEGRDSRVASPSQPPGEDNNTVDGTSNGDKKGMRKGKGNARTKRARSASLEPGDTEANKKAKAKRARSTSPESRDTETSKKPTTTRRRPTGKKTPVAVATKGCSSGRTAIAGAEPETA